MKLLVHRISIIRALLEEYLKSNVWKNVMIANITFLSMV